MTDVDVAPEATAGTGTRVTSEEDGGQGAGANAEPSAAPKVRTAHDLGMSQELRTSLTSNWAEPLPIAASARADGAQWAAQRRQRLSQALPGRRIVLPAGALKTRANDTEYAFRADSSFTWLTGETAADAVLVLEPRAGGGPGHDATLYLREYVGAGDIGYFTDRMRGAIWVGGVPGVQETAALLGLQVRPLTDFAADMASADRSRDVTLLQGIDPDVDALFPGADAGTLGQVLDELRLVKDEWELARLQEACDATTRGFADVVRELPAVLAAGGERGERWLEGTFWRRACYEGNDVGYGSILGAGVHATTLHWWRNNGRIVEGQMLLADMGVETEQLYTADVTRTMPVNGSWTPAQRRVYKAVYEAQTAGIAEVKAGADFLAPHRAAMWVLADHLHSWGVLPVTADVSCNPDPEAPGAGLHRRYTLHSTSHSLGIDVHDCARARAESYVKGTLAAGHVLTVEPGLYFQSHDLSVPDELRGLGVRIEDDIAVTDSEPRNLSASLPREPDELVEWMRTMQASQPDF